MATKRPPGLIYDERDLDAVVRTMLGEAAGEGDEGLAAVAHVLINRLDRGYAGSLYDVAHAPKQFSAWNSGGMGGNDLVDLSTDDPRYQEALAIAEQVLNGQREDVTGGAVNYFAPKGMTGKNGTVKGEPKWAGDMSYTTTIGGHRFYSDDSAAGAAERMASGGNIAQLQQQLASRGFDPGSIDGVRGPRTTAAVKAFQKANGLEADGIVGPLTRAALDRQQRPTTQAPPPGGMRQLPTLPPPPLITNDQMPPRASRWQEEDGQEREGLIRPLPAPAPLSPQGGTLTTRKVSTVPVDDDGNPILSGRTLGSADLGGSVLGAPTPAPMPAFRAPTILPRPRPDVVAPGAPAAPQTGTGFNLGGMLNNIGSTLGSKLSDVGTTLGTTAQNVVEGTGKALADTGEAAKELVTNELLRTVGGRTLAFNTVMGIEPRRDPAADRASSAPEGFAYGSTGRKLYQIGQTYQSSRGPVVFNGKGFQPVGVKTSIDVTPPAPMRTSGPSVRDEVGAMRYHG
jgi:peptidoglycan hydrolase-like protein with peptidoglycan-binding domain